MTGGDAVVETLLAHGVDTGFTVPGESFLTIVEALRVRREAFRLVSVRHEGGGTFAAAAYGRLAARPAAVFVSRGPGATNAAIGVHTAKQGSVPLLLFVGHVRRRSKGREAFQEIDHQAMFAPVAKAVMEPRETTEIVEVTARAVEESVQGRPGPVVVVMPRDLTEAPFEGTLDRPPTPRAPVRAGDAVLGAAARRIEAARFPLIVAGEMVIFEEAGAALVEFADALGAPLVGAYRQQDVFPNRHPAYAGHLEINRAAFQREAFAKSDLVIALGTRLDGITTEDYALLAGGQDLLHVYPEERSLAVAGAKLRLLCDVAPALAAWKSVLADPPRERLEWRDALHAAYTASAAPDGGGAQGAVDLAAVTDAVARAVPEDAVVVTDAGSFSRWVHRFYRFDGPRTFAGPVSGAMGYAVPGALGAKLARPSSTVIAFVGDGGFMMTGQELATAAGAGLDINVVVCDNRAHGSILHPQRLAFGDGADYATRMQSPDFVQIAQAYGARAWRVERTDEFPAAFAAAVAHPGPTLVHLVTDERDIVPAASGDDTV